MKLDLTNTRIDLAAAKAAAVMKLGEMNNELIKVKRDFTIKLEGNFNLTRDFNQLIVTVIECSSRKSWNTVCYAVTSTCSCSCSSTRWS